ncbi:MAG: hypothetical protein D9V47_13155 [Clostridia bacterium]|nr:MAG: hypothetical protein D9V47_13155 [Clostridia bacterium]
MPDREEDLSRYIDYLNQERKPLQSVEDGPGDWQELLAAARLAKSMRPPVMPEPDFPRQMAGRLARLLGIPGQNTRSIWGPWRWLGGAAAVITIVLLSWHVLAQVNWPFGEPPRVAMQAQENLQAGSQGEPPAGREYDQARVPAPAGEVKAQGGEATAAQGKGTADAGTVAGGGLARQREAQEAAAPEVETPAEGGPVAGANQAEGAALEPETRATPSPREQKSLGSVAMVLPQPQGQQAEKLERPGTSSRSLETKAIQAPGLRVEISLDRAALQQPGRFTVRLANTTSGGLSLTFPTPILVIKEVGSGEAVWKAALALNLPFLLGAGKEVAVATTWPGPERPGWYTASVVGISATAIGGEATDTVPLQNQPMEFFVPYPPGKIRAAGELQPAVRASREGATVTVEKVSFTPDSALVRLAVQAAGLNTPLDLQVTAAWDGGQAESPRQVVQEVGNGSVRISAWFNPAPATAGRLHLVAVVKGGPADIDSQPWSLDVPLGVEPAGSEKPPEQPANGSVPQEVYGNDGQPAPE